VAKYAPPTEDTDADYPVILTTGRAVNMFLSGDQTRRIGPLVDQYPEPLPRSGLPGPSRLPRHASRAGGKVFAGDSVAA
jgi:hypothetical protein